MPSCCVVGCKNSGKTPGVVFHRFPVKRLKLWAKAVNRKNFVATRNHRICGAHFVSGYPGWERDDVDWIPTLSLRPPAIVSPMKARIIKEKLLRVKRRSEKIEASYSEFLARKNENKSMTQSLSFHDYTSTEDLKVCKLELPELEETLQPLNETIIAEANLNVVVKSEQGEIPIVRSISQSTQTSPLVFEEENEALRSEIKVLRLFIEKQGWSVTTIK